MIRIRLARRGAKNHAHYSIVVADSRAPRDGRFIEKIGVYNPRLSDGNPDRVRFDIERALAWAAKGATPTERVRRLLSVATNLTLATQPK